MKAVYFYMDTIVAIKPLWYGTQYVTAQWDGKDWRTLTDEEMPRVDSIEKAEMNLRKWAEKKGLHYAGCHGCRYLSVGVCCKSNPIKRLICVNTVYYIRSKECRFWVEDESQLI